MAQIITYYNRLNNPAIEKLYISFKSTEGGNKSRISLKTMVW